MREQIDLLHQHISVDKILDHKFINLFTNNPQLVKKIQPYIHELYERKGATLITSVSS